MLKVAVIGVGSMGQNHVRVYSNFDGIELVGVSDASVTQGQKIASKFKTKFYSDYHVMLTDARPDIVSIAVPSQLHKEVAIEAMRRGVNVLLEKPIALNEMESEEIIAAAKKYNVKLMIGHIERFNPAIIELKKHLAKNEIGSIYKIDVQRIGPFPDRINDVGVILDLAVHDIDIIEYVTGLSVEGIYAQTQQKIHSSCEDSLCAIIKYSGDVIASLNINYLSPRKIRTISFFGEKGMFEVNYLEQNLTLYKNGTYKDTDNMVEKFRGIAIGDCIHLSIPKEEPLFAEIKSFINCVRNDEEPMVTGKQGLHALHIANLLIESAQKNKAIQR